MDFTTRAYNSFELNSKTKASIIKSSEEDRLLGEIEYYQNLPKNIQVYFPRMLNYSTDEKIYQMELEYYAYGNLGNVMTNQDYDPDFWIKVFDFIFSYINNYKESTSISASKEDSLLMFVDKTEKEYTNLMYKFDFFSQFRNTKEFVFNGKILKSFDVIWEKIKSYIETSVYDDKFHFIHGDLCFSNILYGVNDITNDVILKFIDPRGVFGKTKFFGDSYYDLAKISHSCNGGYEFFIYDKFDFFSQFRNTKEFVFNGKILKSFDVIWEKIKSYIKTSICNDKFHFIHGDLCFSNILYGVNDITNDVILKFIDPRGVFGKTKFFGDSYYDLAKISHSCNGGYEFFIYDKFDVSNVDNQFKLSFQNEQRKNDINNKFLSISDEYKFDYNKIKLIEGLIFVGMCARHYDNLDRQKAMLMTGLNILNDVYKNL